MSAEEGVQVERTVDGMAPHRSGGSVLSVRVHVRSVFVDWPGDTEKIY